MYNYRAGSIYVHLDGLLFDLKYDPSVIEIPVPRYFKEDDRIPINIEFKPVDRGGKKKGGKKKKGKKGKKKKAADDDEEQKEELTISEKEGKIDEILNENFGTDEPVEEVIEDPFSLDLDFILALR